MNGEESFDIEIGLWTERRRLRFWREAGRLSRGFFVTVSRRGNESPDILHWKVVS